MARTGDVIDSGEVRMRFVRTTADTQGELVEVEATYRPHSRPPPLHFHPSQEERFEILEGALRFELDGVVHEVAKGSTLVVPPRGVHRAHNPLDVPTKVMWITRPALQTEAFFETLYGLAAQGKLGASGRPSLLHVAAIARKYQDVWQLASPPRIVQSCVFGILAPVAKAMGIRV